jgi:hypothetical protein
MMPFAQPMSSIAPIRTKPLRTYDECSQEFSAEGAHTPFLIRKLKKASKSRSEFDQYLAHFGESSGLFRSVGVRDFGKQPTSPFAIEITLARNALNLRNVGYGVSQSLPVVVEFFAQPKRSAIAVQQPEVHLHPRAQAALGDVIFRLAVEEHKTFFIETHSDFAIDRFRLNYRKAEKTPDAQVLFFERTEKGNCVTPLRFTDKGRYPAEQPPAFRSFFLKEERLPFWLLLMTRASFWKEERLR